MNPEGSAPIRPLLVTLLAIFTLVGTVFYFGFELLGSLVPEVRQDSVPVPVWMTAILYVTQLGKAVAAILLMGMRKIGFYLYAGLEFVSAVVGILVGKFTMDYMNTSYVNPDIGFDPQMMVIALMAMSIGLSIAFIGGFAAHMSKMR